ncbi:LytR/AlgR family response regulator transcription factor [Aquimarina megaterium]|uniref:LytR/AlgR family response regulator transcription factor n=1 Tax=Aquimarina megaterium TaxID=1443666 RepID=UPI000942EBFC|nr:LytTR family DNA-binding domain-containing protein [Aquimarina megaterium]
MRSRITLISAFSIVNLLIGRLFQESLQIVCFSELIAVAVSSFIFWNLAMPQIKRTIRYWNLFTTPRHILAHSGMAIFTSVLNILVSQALILFLMLYVYQCTSPSFSFINASLTNNIALNLLCYFSLVFYSMQRNLKKEGSGESNVPTPSNSNTNFISLTYGNTKKIIPIEDVKFIEASNNCIVFNTNEGRFVRYQSLKTFLNEYNGTDFKRVHRSYAVNIKYVNCIQKNKNGDGIITLTDNKKIKLSRTYRSSLVM